MESHEGIQLFDMARLDSRTCSHAMLAIHIRQPLFIICARHACRQYLSRKSMELGPFAVAGCRCLSKHLQLHSPAGCRQKTRASAPGAHDAPRPNPNFAAGPMLLRRCRAGKSVNLSNCTFSILNDRSCRRQSRPNGSAGCAVARG